MAEQKKTAPKKTAAAGRVAGRAKSAKALVATTAKTEARKSTAATVELKKSRTPAVKKAAAPAAEKKAPARKAAAKARDRTGLPPEERYRMVQTAAYFIAERNGFQGCSTDHWAAAELEISALLGE